MKTLEQRIETYKRQARAMQRELGDKNVRVTSEYEFGVKDGCDHCGRYITTKRLVVVDGRKQWWGKTCAGKAQMIELFLGED